MQGSYLEFQIVQILHGSPGSLLTTPSSSAENTHLMSNWNVTQLNAVYH